MNKAYRANIVVTKATLNEADFHTEQERTTTKLCIINQIQWKLRIPSPHRTG